MTSVVHNDFCLEAIILFQVYIEGKYCIKREGPVVEILPNWSMGMTSDEAVLIQSGREPGDPYVITINCLVKDGLACDICHTILEYGLCIIKGDISTDGKWCYFVMWVVAQPSSLTVNWSNFKERLLCVCPPCSVTFHYYQPTACVASSPVYLLKFFCLDRNGLLHDVTQVLCELELTIQRVKVTTTPDGRVLDLFFVTDNTELLHTRSRHDETCERLHTVLGESCISCELQLAGPEYDARQGLSSSLSPSIIENLFVPELSDKDSCYQTLGPDLNKLKKASITMDNSLSPAHTLLQIGCVDQKGLLYDILRPLKDAGIQIAYGRVSKKSKGYRDIDLFIQQQDGKKIVDSVKQNTLRSRLKMEMLHPLRVMIASRGPDTELWVANPVEMSGKGRPRVFYDVTYALKLLSICIFSAEIGRYSSDDREWEVYRFLLDDRMDYDLSDKATRNQIVQSVIRTLMGW